MTYLSARKYSQNIHKIPKYIPTCSHACVFVHYHPKKFRAGIFYIGKYILFSIRQLIFFKPWLYYNKIDTLIHNSHIAYIFLNSSENQTCSPGINIYSVWCTLFWITAHCVVYFMYSDMFCLPNLTQFHYSQSFMQPTHYFIEG